MITFYKFSASNVDIQGTFKIKYEVVNNMTERAQLETESNKFGDTAPN